MSRRRPPAELLPILAEAFPQTFFTDPAQVRPLKIDIHKDLLACLPAGIKGYEVKSFLWWYTHRPGYNRALLHGISRVDLTGAAVDAEIPDFIREQARERLLELETAKRKAKAGKQPAATPGQSRPAASATPLNLEDLYAMAIDAKLEITLKFSVLPNAKSAGSGKMAFALKTPDGQFVTVVINNKAWSKLTKAAEEWPSWVAALSGSMGERTAQGFTLAGPGLQVFERKAKADTAATTDTPPAEPAIPPPTEPTAPPPPAAPTVTVVTKAGAATVTRRTPLSLKR